MGYRNLSGFPDSPQRKILTISYFGQPRFGGHSGLPSAMAGAADRDNASKETTSNSSVLFTAKLLIEVEVAP
jgi:hypothetical protein